MWSPDLGVERVYRVLGAKGLEAPRPRRLAVRSLLCCSLPAALCLERGGRFLGGNGRVGGAASLVLAAVVGVLAAKH